MIAFVFLLVSALLFVALLGAVIWFASDGDITQEEKENVSKKIMTEINKELRKKKEAEKRIEELEMVKKRLEEL